MQKMFTKNLPFFVFISKKRLDRITVGKKPPIKSKVKEYTRIIELHATIRYYSYSLLYSCKPYPRVKAIPVLV